MQFNFTPNIDVDAFVATNLAPDWQPGKLPWAALEILKRCPERARQPGVHSRLLALLDAERIDVRRDVAKILFESGYTDALKHIVYAGLSTHPITKQSQRTTHWPIDVVRYSEYLDDECIEAVLSDIESSDRSHHCDALSYLEPQIARACMERLWKGNNQCCRRSAAYLAATLGKPDDRCIHELTEWANDPNELQYLALRGLARAFDVPKARDALSEFLTNRQSAKLYSSDACKAGREWRARIEHYADALHFIVSGVREEQILSLMQREYFAVAEEVKLYQVDSKITVDHKLATPLKYFTDWNRRYPVSLSATVFLAEFATPSIRANLAEQQWDWMKSLFESGVFSFQSLLAGKLVATLSPARLANTGLEPRIGAASETALVTLQYDVNDYQRAAQSWIEYPVRYRSTH